MQPKFFAVILICSPVFTYTQSLNDSAQKNWSGSVEGYYYLIPGEKLPPTITGFADYKSLHLEARFNYEDINSLSVFAGWNFEKRYGKLDITATPITGLVIGRTNGILPGIEFSASYSIFNFYSENEYMLDFKGKDNYFFYSWTELNAQFSKNIAAGVLAQSLRWYKTKFDIQRGIYAEYNLGSFTFNVYYFNPFTSFNFTIAAASFTF